MRGFTRPRVVHAPNPPKYEIMRIVSAALSRVPSPTAAGFPAAPAAPPGGPPRILQTRVCYEQLHSRVTCVTRVTCVNNPHDFMFWRIRTRSTPFHNPHDLMFWRIRACRRCREPPPGAAEGAPQWARARPATAPPLRSSEAGWKPPRGEQDEPNEEEKAIACGLFMSLVPNSTRDEARRCLQDKR